MIPKGCVCKDSFVFPYAESDVELIFITYQQSLETVIEKEISDCEFSENQVSVILSQEETLMFDSAQPILIQIRVKLKDGSVTKSKIIKTNTDIVLKNEVI